MTLAEERVAGVPTYDKQPPQDVAAEQSVLGGMMLSKDAIADVVEVLSPTDFYRPAHQAVYDCVLDLYARGEPADPITVSAELEKRGELARVGGAPYLHTLIATVPTAANAGYYAQIVADKAVLRRLVEAGTRIVQLGYAGGEGDEIDEVVDRAQSAIYDVTERRMSEDYIALEELLQPTMDEIDAIASRGGASLGVPTGFVDLDELTNGLHPGQMIIIAARPGVGKALALDTPLPTPGGWTTMGEVQVGDRLMGVDGLPTTVIAATGVLRDRPCYEVRFSDGTDIVADAQHQWLTWAGGRSRVRTTEDIARTLGEVHQVRHAAAPVKIWDTVAGKSVPLRCVQVDAADHLYLAGRGRIPTHNSTLGLDIARSASVRHGMTSVIFSLEMSRTEIVMRMLSAEARIRLQDMRGGRMSDDDWTRLARRMSEISEAPLFVDDSPNMTMMEIRAKARRLKQRNDLKLIVVDYMQLMTSGKRVESRQQEVSEFSRQLKLLAKELEVPVVAISQLNRGPEQRTDKRPMLSDLRESGCLTAATRVLRADTGTEVTMGELMHTGERPLVWSLDERLRMVPRPMTKVFCSGVKQVFRLRLTSGREVEASGNHPFLTLDGWCALEDLRVGDRLAVPRQVPEPLQPERMADAEGVSPLLARCGIFSRAKRATKAGYRDGWHLIIDDLSDRRMAQKTLAQRTGLRLYGTRTYAHASSRTMLARTSSTLDDRRLADLSISDVFWDKIAEIVPLGEREVFDATVSGTHNFVANGIHVHNSLEQDADVVLLIHRPDAWERDDPRAGEADLIVAKHRSGPTNTITVAHQLHYSRFADLAQG